MVETAALLCAFSGTLLLLMPWIDEISKGYVKKYENAFSQHIRGRYFSMQRTYWASVLSDSDSVSVSAGFSSTFSSAAFLSFLAGRCWAAAC